MRLISAVVAVMMIVSVSDVLGMGKSDGSKKKVEKPLVKKEEVKAETSAKPVKAETPATVKKADDGEVAVKPVAKPGEDKVVVTVNGVAIKESEVNKRLDDGMKMRMGRMGASGKNLPAEALKGLRDRMRKEVVDGMVLEQLVDQKLKAQKIEISDEDVGAKIEEIMKTNSITLDTIKEELAKNGVTLDAFKAQMKRNLGIEKLIDAEMKAAGEAAEATEEEAKKFYDENKRQFSTPEQVRASHILIKAEGMDEEGKAEAKKKIEDLLKKARGGEDFGELAKQYSEDPGSKDKGGEYVFGRGKMVPPFEKAAFSLEVGGISDVVETNYGYHIIKLSEKMPAETKSFEEVKERLVRDLGNRKKGKFWNTVREKLKSEAKIEYSAEEQAKRQKPASPRVIQPSVRTKPSSK